MDVRGAFGEDAVSRHRLVSADCVEKVALSLYLGQSLVIRQRDSTQHDGTVIEWYRLFYSLNLEDHIPKNHLLRSIDRCIDLNDLRHYLTKFYSPIARPSIDT